MQGDRKISATWHPDLIPKPNFKSFLGQDGISSEIYLDTRGELRHRRVAEITGFITRKMLRNGLKRRRASKKNKKYKRASESEKESES